jgi:hypothetical protein
MGIALRKLTAREHVLAATVLVFTLTMITADIVMAGAARLRSAGYTATPSLLACLPIFAGVVGLIALLPRTANESRYFLFRLVGKWPLLVRYFVIGITVCGLTETIKALAS